MPDRGYPQTVIELLDENIPFRSSALEAVRDFAGSDPWQGNIEQRQEKLRELNHNLSAACGITEPTLAFGVLNGGSSSGSLYIPSQHRIVLVGRLSVVTYLHEFAHALGLGERDACRWSINLFRRFFPAQYARLIHVGHMLVRPADLATQIRRRKAR